MPMYNLLEYSKNYRKTIGSLYNYYRDELTDDDNDDNFGNIKVVNSNTFKYKNKILAIHMMLMQEFQIQMVPNKLIILFTLQRKVVRKK